MSPEPAAPPVSEAIENQGSLILTPNASLAQQLRRRRLLNANRQAAPAARIEVLQSWLVSSIEPERPLATDTQLRFLWAQLITEQRDENQAFQQINPDHLASQALSAWRTLKHWQISYEELANAEIGQLISFKKWAVEFEKRLAKNQLSTLELELEKRLHTSEAQKGALVQTYAFIDPPAPLFQNWLAQQFEHIEALPYSAENASACNAMLCAQDSSEQELAAALHWAQSIFDAASQNGQQPRIAMIDVRLKDRLKTTQRQVEAAFGQEPAASQSIRFSREQPLPATGCAQTALKLLSLNRQQIDLATARYIVHSPLWGNQQQEYSQRAQWDIELCALQSSEVNTSDFLALVQNSDKAESISNIARVFTGRHRNKQLSPLDWCNLFQQQLHLLGCLEHFPGNTWEHWLNALVDFSKLGKISATMDISEALQQLQYCCANSLPKVSSSAPGLTFLDTIEAAADYSHIWVLGMDNLNWPGAPRLNPLLPVSLQIARQIPHSHPQLQTDLTRRLIERLQQACGELVFSYCRVDEDLQQSPCAFVADLPSLSLTIDDHPAPNKNTDFEWLDCASGPEVPEQQREVHGGANLLKAMAVSPFHAFAQWRLGAYELDTPKIGLSALDRGNLVHDCLELVWKKLGSSKALSALTNAETQELCTTMADKSIKRFQAKNGWLKQSYAQIEVDRLSQLVSDWLELERQRSEFSVELAEQPLQADLAGLRFNMRLDRLDRLNDGKLVLIDYKTGQTLSRNFWLQMPPIEPQLPLYALTLENTPDALCFAKVRTDKMEFIGIAKERVEGMQGISEQDNWTELLQEWKESLQDLARDYIHGDSRVFEKVATFGQADPWAPLHRFAEFQQIHELQAPQKEQE